MVQRDCMACGKHLEKSIRTNGFITCLDCEDRVKDLDLAHFETVDVVTRMDKRDVWVVIGLTPEESRYSCLVYSSFNDYYEARNAVITRHVFYSSAVMQAVEILERSVNEPH